MSYTTRNFKTKKELKEAVANGDVVTLQNNGRFKPRANGIEHVEGPWYPTPHTWYAEVTMKDGKVVKVK